jgi:arylsulfatase A-like enzyme
MDFYPTILEYARLPLKPEQHRDGISLKNIIEGKKSETHTSMVWDFPHYHGSGWTPGRALRLGPWKLVYFFEDEQYELYHLENDPGEKIDLVNQAPEQLEHMKKLLIEWTSTMKAQNPTVNIKTL